MDIRADTGGDGRAPRPLWAIAIAGLAPFPAAALTYLYGPVEAKGAALSALLTWSAVMLGFLGGVRWGLESGRAEPRWTRLALSAVSPIAGWALLFAREAVPVPWLLGGFMAAFILQWLYDHSAPDVPARYPRLMTALTLGACISLAMAMEQALKL